MYAIAPFPLPHFVTTWQEPRHQRLHTLPRRRRPPILCLDINQPSHVAAAGGGRLYAHHRCRHARRHLRSFRIASSHKRGSAAAATSSRITMTAIGQKQFPAQFHASLYSLAFASFAAAFEFHLKQRTCPSLLPVANWLPSPLQSTADTSCVCCDRVNMANRERTCAAAVSE